MAKSKITGKKRKERAASIAATKPPMELKSYLPEEYKERKAGRPSLFTDEILPRVEELAAKGLTNNEIADALGIHHKTFYDWRDKYPQFLHSVKKYRGLADIQVENALFKSAIGFNFTEVKKERRKVGKDDDGRDKYELVVTEKVTKHIPGVSAAQIFYLKNRMPERYKDKIETQISLSDDISSIAFALKRRGE